MAEREVSVRTYVVIFGALLLLLAATTGLSFVDLSPLSTLVALTIAAAKAVLVILYFMHVRLSTRLTWVFAGAGFYWLAILITLTLTDLLTRRWLAP